MLFLNLLIVTKKKQPFSSYQSNINERRTLFCILIGEYPLRITNKKRLGLNNGVLENQWISSDEIFTSAFFVFKYASIDIVYDYFRIIRYFSWQMIFIWLTHFPKIVFNILVTIVSYMSSCLVYFRLRYYTAIV